MATSDLVQYLSAKDRSTGASSTGASDRRVVETFLAGGDITAGDIVCFDTSQTGADRIVYVVKADAGAAATHQAIGVCLDTIDVSEVSDFRVQVVVKGYVEGANVANAVSTVGALLNAGTTAGRAVAYQAADTEAPFAQALEAASGNTADIFVLGVFS